MNGQAFDTHAFVKRLTGAGMPEAQAEVLADEQRRLIDHRLATKEDVAGLERVTRLEIEKLRVETLSLIGETKAELSRDIAGVKAELSRDIAGVKAELSRDLAETKAEILKWMFGAIGFQTVVILGAVLALSRLGR